ncbi:MAG: hypothetical protein KQJ78_13325 [Deltaproteobacteria bacterium]|nr:hypothetical protein [Deltaproteobacteria bacterium]
MLKPDDPEIPAKFAEMHRKITAMGVEGWLSSQAASPSLDALVYLCKFAYFTGIFNKAELAVMLGADRTELKHLVRAWYDDHRAKGCGIC